MVKWCNDKKIDKELIFKRLKENKANVYGRKIPFEKWLEFEKCITILHNILEMNKAIPQGVIDSSIRKVITQLSEITPESFLEALQKIERDYLKKDQSDYYLISDISISDGINQMKFDYDRYCVVINEKLNENIIKNREQLIQEKGTHLFSKRRSKNYAPVSVKVCARSTLEAAEKALDLLNFIRGVFNLWESYKNPSVEYSIYCVPQPPKPSNAIILSPMHTLHTSNGDLATKNFWIDWNFTGRHQEYSNKENLSHMHEYCTKFLKKLKKRNKNYQEDIYYGVVRYVRALDEVDKVFSFCQLWSVLEHLTNTLNAKYNETIKRACFLFHKEREYHSAVLNHLRNKRNSLIHKDCESLNMEALLKQLKEYVEALIEFHFFNEFNFKSLGAAASFLDLPTIKNEIDGDIKKKSEDIKALKKAKQFLFKE